MDNTISLYTWEKLKKGKKIINYRFNISIQIHKYIYRTRKIYYTNPL